MVHIISLLVENHAGVLSRISGLFSGRGYSLESITYGETTDPSLVRVTLTCRGDNNVIEQIKKQLNRLIDTIKIMDLTHKPAVHREIALIKIGATLGNRSEAMQIIHSYGGRILDISTDSLICEMTEEEDKINDFLRVMQDYNIIEMARSGLVSLERGKKNKIN